MLEAYQSPLETVPLHLPVQLIYLRALRAKALAVLCRLQAEPVIPRVVPFPSVQLMRPVLPPVEQWPSIPVNRVPDLLVPLTFALATLLAVDVRVRLICPAAGQMVELVVTLQFKVAAVLLLRVGL
jgi:hypothetical protein